MEDPEDPEDRKRALHMQRSGGVSGSAPRHATPRPRDPREQTGTYYAWSEAPRVYNYPRSHFGEGAHSDWSRPLALECASSSSVQETPLIRTDWSGGIVRSRSALRHCCNQGCTAALYTAEAVVLPGTAPITAHPGPETQATVDGLIGRRREQ